MPKEKYDPPDPRRCYTIMSAEDAANGKKSYWAELEISGQSRLLSLFCVIFLKSVDLFVVSHVRLFVGAVYFAIFIAENLFCKWFCDCILK